MQHTHQPRTRCAAGLYTGIIDVVGAAGAAATTDKLGTVNKENLDNDVGGAPGPAVLKSKATLKLTNEPGAGTVGGDAVVEGAVARPVEMDTSPAMTVPVAGAGAGAAAAAAEAPATAAVQAGATPGV